MNGTAVMTALACLAYDRADYLTRLATRLTAFNVLASDGNAHHFDEMLFAAKPHPGQMQIAARPARRPAQRSSTAQRTAPAGPLLAALRAARDRGVQDALPFFRQLIETELNSANDTR